MTSQLQRAVDDLVEAAPASAVVPPHVFERASALRRRRRLVAVAASVGVAVVLVASVGVAVQVVGRGGSASETVVAGPPPDVEQVMAIESTGPLTADQHAGALEVLEHRGGIMGLDVEEQPTADGRLRVTVTSENAISPDGLRWLMRPGRLTAVALLEGGAERPLYEFDPATGLVFERLIEAEGPWWGVEVSIDRVRPEHALDLVAFCDVSALGGRTGQPPGLPCPWRLDVDAEPIAEARGLTPFDDDTPMGARRLSFWFRDEQSARRLAAVVAPGPLPDGVELHASS